MTRASWTFEHAFGGGWCVTVRVGTERLSRFFGPQGGEWELRGGVQGQQLVGTCDVRAPQSETKFRAWARRYLAGAVADMRSDAAMGYPSWLLSGYVAACRIADASTGRPRPVKRAQHPGPPRSHPTMPTTPRTTSDVLIARAVRAINHGSDGPVTPFVAMSRACELAASGEYTADECANALHTVLSRMGLAVQTDTGASVFNTADGGAS